MGTDLRALHPQGMLLGSRQMQPFFFVGGGAHTVVLQLYVNCKWALNP